MPNHPVPDSDHAPKDAPRSPFAGCLILIVMALVILVLISSAGYFLKKTNERIQNFYRRGSKSRSHRRSKGSRDKIQLTRQSPPPFRPRDQQQSCRSTLNVRARSQSCHRTLRDPKKLFGDNFTLKKLPTPTSAESFTSPSIPPPSSPASFAVPSKSNHVKTT